MGRGGLAPEVGGAATLAVRDDLFPENEGPFRIRAQDGRLEVEPAPGDSSGRTSGTAIGIGALSALYGGYMTPADLVRAGLVSGDEPGLELLGHAFAGPAPWMTDFF